MRTLVILKCSECKAENYTVTKNKKLHPDRQDFLKYCPSCKKETIHKEKK